MCIVGKIVPHLIPTTNEVPEFCQVGGRAQVDEGVNFHLGRAEALWTSNVNPREIDLLATLQLVSGQLYVLLSASFQYLSECVGCLVMVCAFT